MLTSGSVVTFSSPLTLAHFLFTGERWATSCRGYRWQTHSEQSTPRALTRVTIAKNEPSENEDLFSSSTSSYLGAAPGHRRLLIGAGPDFLRIIRTPWHRGCSTKLGLKALVDNVEVWVQLVWAPMLMQDVGQVTFSRFGGRRLFLCTVYSHLWSRIRDDGLPVSLLASPISLYPAQTSHSQSARTTHKG